MSHIPLLQIKSAEDSLSDRAGQELINEETAIEDTPVSTTRIDDLPNEVLLKILKKLEQSDSDLSALVSSKWEQIVSEGIGFILDPNDDIKLISKVGFNRCVFREVVGEAPSFKIPLLVHSVWFIAQISTSNFEKLLLPLTNLKEFKINIQALSRLDFESIPALAFPELKEFTLLYPKYSTLTFVRLQNTINMLKKLQCPKLEELNLVGIPLVRSKEGNVIEAIHSLVERTGKTLKKVLMNLQEGTLHFTENIRNQLNEEIPIPTTVTGSHHITKYYLECSCSREVVQSDILVLVNSWLNQQGKLEELYLNTLFHIQIPTQLIAKNETTLTSIEMSILAVDGVLDCALFTFCSLLRVLTIVGRSMAAWDEEIFGPVIQQIRNANSLPTSLKSLRIANFLVSTDDAEFMALNLPNLLLLELVNIGESDVFGVSLETLNEIFLRRTIKAIRIGHGVSETGLLHPPPALALTAALFLRLSDRQRRRFNIYLDDNDQYSFGHGNLIYFRENSTTFLVDDEPNDIEQTRPYRFHDYRLCFNPRFGIEDLIEEADDWFAEDDDDDDEDDDEEDQNDDNDAFVPMPTMETDSNVDIDDSQTEVPWPTDESGYDNDNDDLDEDDIQNDGTEETTADDNDADGDDTTVDDDDEVSKDNLQLEAEEDEENTDKTNTENRTDNEENAATTSGVNNQSQINNADRSEVKETAVEGGTKNINTSTKDNEIRQEEDDDDATSNGETILVQTATSNDDSYMLIIASALIVFAYYYYILAHFSLSSEETPTDKDDQTPDNDSDTEDGNDDES